MKVKDMQSKLDRRVVGLFSHEIDVTKLSNGAGDFKVYRGSRQLYQCKACIYRGTAYYIDSITGELYHNSILVLRSYKTVIGVAILPNVLDMSNDNLVLIQFGYYSATSSQHFRKFKEMLTADYSGYHVIHMRTFKPASSTVWATSYGLKLSLKRKAWLTLEETGYSEVIDLAFRVANSNKSFTEVIKQQAVIA